MLSISNSEGSRTELGCERDSPAGNRAEHLPAEHLPLATIGFLSSADGNFAGGYVQASSVVRAFLFCRFPDRWQRLLQLAQDVSADLPIRWAFALLRPGAHRCNPFSVSAVIAEQLGKIIFNRNANSYGTRA